VFSGDVDSNLSVGGNLSVTGTATLTGNADFNGDLDVDGTTNLDVVDIDGAVDMASTLQVDGAITSSAGATITTADNTVQLTLKSTDADANVGPILDMIRDSASPADGDEIGRIRFKGDDDAGNETTYAFMQVKINDATDASDDGELEILTRTNGSNRSRIEMFPSETVLNEDSQDIDFRVESDGNANMFFVDAGNDKVGVGTNTPAARFSALSTSGTTTDIGRFEAAVGSYTGTSLVAGNTLGAASSYNLFSCITDSDADAGGPVTQFLVRGDGKVGIGTSSPASLLEIKASALNRDNGIALRGSGANDILYMYPSADNVATIEHLINGSTSTGGPIHINPQGGQVAVGDSTGASYSDGGLFTRHAGGANNSPFCVVNGTTSGTRRMIDFFVGTGTSRVGSIQSNDSATAFNTSSDYRLKENVTDMTGAINRVKALAPKRFNFIVSPDTTVDGFLAHEVSSIVPEAISGEKDEVATWGKEEELPDGVKVGDNKLDDDGNTIPIMQGIDHSKLVPVLTGALREAIAKIETLETQNTTQATQIADLINRVNALEAG
jgi:hypothetical protein